MKAIIKLDIPEYQIGQEVSIYFKDTMMIKGVVQKPKTDILNKIKNEIEQMPSELTTDGRRMIRRGSVFRIIEKYKSESEE